jgi:hypothetical protein
MHGGLLTRRGRPSPTGPTCAMRTAQRLWAAPCSAIGLALGAWPLVLSGKAAWSDGALEVTYRIGRSGHVRASSPVTREELQQIGAHERVHVAQYERWGPLFFLAYGASGLWQLLNGRRPYWDNAFEVQARRLGSAAGHASVRRDAES